MSLGGSLGDFRYDFNYDFTQISFVSTNDSGDFIVSVCKNGKDIYDLITIKDAMYPNGILPLNCVGFKDFSNTWFAVKTSDGVVGEYFDKSSAYKINYVGLFNRY